MSDLNKMSDFCKTETSTKQCDSSVRPNMTAADACTSEKTIIDNAINKMSEGMSDWSPAGILKALGASNKSNSKFQNIINSVQESITNTDAIQLCSNNTKVIQTNQITGEKCAKIQSDTIVALSKLPNAKDLLDKYYESITVKNVTQQNKNDIKQQCVLQQALKAVKNFDISVESSAITKLLQSAKDLLASNESNTDQCQVINSTQTACDYLKSTLCCTNQADVQQTNLLECKGVNDVNQENINSQLQICNLTGSTTVDTILGQKATAKTLVDISQKAVGTSAWALIIFVLVIFFVPLVAPVFVGAKIATKETKSGIPYLLILFSFICLISILIFGTLYLNYGKKEYASTKENKPLYCNSNKCNSSSIGGDVSITYEKAFKKCLDNNDCVALDFSHPKEGYNKDSSSVSGEPYNIYGTSVYYNSAEMCDEDSCNSKNKTYTAYKRDEKFYFYGFVISSILFVCCILLIFVMSVKKSETGTGGVAQVAQVAQVA